MPRVQVYQGGNVMPQGTTDARVRAADFSANGLGVGLKAAGEALSDAVQKHDEVEDIKARVEANRLAVEHSKISRQIGRRVKETLGEGAEAAADAGATELEQATKEILGRATPRARMLLQNELAQRNILSQDDFSSHGFREKAAAFEASSKVRIENILEDAADQDDEAAAINRLREAIPIYDEMARFYGRDQAWKNAEARKTVSSFYRSRALRLTIGDNGSAHAAIEYATANRRYMTDEDYNAIVSAYNDNALDELATSVVDGAPLPTAATVTGSEGEPPRKIDPIAFFKGFISPHEGAAYVVDSNGAGVKYGINEAFNKGVDVKNLTEDKAANLFAANHWKRSGADKLPPALAAVHADTFFLNEKQAAKILKESGGDVDRYIELRKSFLNGLIADNPGKYGKYKPGWDRRTKDLAEYAARQGTDGTPLPIGPDTSLDDFRKSVMARTDIGMALKRKIIARAESRRSDARQEQAIVESNAEGELAQAAAGLGDGFTDVKQLPQGSWLRASPQTRARFTEAAKSNKDNKPLSPQMAAQIGFIRTFKPESLADPKVLSTLAAQGVPQRTIAQLAEEGGRAKGALAGAKAEAVDRGTLEALARDPFKAAGFDFWSVESKDEKAKVVEERDEAQRRVQLLNFLSTEANAWALANPGKRADSKTIQGWIGTSLIRVGQQGRARPFGSLSDTEVINSYGQKNYNETVRRLRAVGIEPTAANVANYLRRFFARSHGAP